MFRRNTNHKDYAELDALLDFAYSSKARKCAERARNYAISGLISPSTSRHSTTGCSPCNPTA